jgi:hypothetical protein
MRITRSISELCDSMVIHWKALKCSPLFESDPNCVGMPFEQPKNYELHHWRFLFQRNMCTQALLHIIVTRNLRAVTVGQINAYFIKNQISDGSASSEPLWTFVQWMFLGHTMYSKGLCAIRTTNIDILSMEVFRSEPYFTRNLGQLGQTHAFGTKYRIDLCVIRTTICLMWLLPAVVFDLLPMDPGLHRWEGEFGGAFKSQNVHEVHHFFQKSS